jgi:hypothetical protein
MGKREGWGPVSGAVSSNRTDSGPDSATRASTSGLAIRAWPKSRVLELAPAFWKQTAEQQDTQKRLAANVFRIATLAAHTHGV